MSRNVRLAKNAGWLMAMELGVRGLDAVVVIILARYLAPQGFGLLAFAISFAGLFDILPGFGMGSMSVRDVARDPQQLGRVLSNGVVVKTLLAGATLAVIFLFSCLLGHSPDRRLIVMLAALLLVIETNVQYLLSFFQATDRMSTVTMVNVGVRLSWLLSSFAVIALHGGIVQLLGARVLVTAVGFLITTVLVHFRVHRIQWRFEPSFAWSQLKSSVPFALFRVWMELYGDIDMVMLSMMRGDISTSMYAAAQKILRIFSFIPAGFGAATLPAMSRSSKRSPEEVAEMTAKTCKYLLIVGSAVAGGVCVLAGQIIALLYGPAYREAAMVLRVMAWSVVFSFLNGTIISAVVSVDRERQGSNRLFVGVLFSALSNLAVIPGFGQVGAAFTTVLARALIFMLQFRLLKKVFPTFRLPDVGKVAAAVLFMMGAAWVSRPAGLPVAIGVGGAVYLAVLMVTRTVGREEWTFAGKLFQGKGAKG